MTGPRTTEQFLPSLIGREPELAALTAALGEALAGQGGLSLVVGEAGIGKTRLVDELGHAAESAGARVLWGRAWEAGGAPAYFPWTQVFRSLASAHGDEAVRQYAGSALPDIVELLPARFRETESEARKDPASARFRLFDAVSEVLKRATEREPLVVVLDDLHAADPSSLSLLHFVTRHLRGARLFVVGTRRDEDAQLTAESRELLARIAREGATVTLARLDQAAVASLVRARLGRAAAGVERLYEATEGNPLFVLEFIRLAEERGGDIGAARLPESVLEALGARLAILDAPAQRTLEVASVLGREFEVATVATLAGSTAGEVAGSLAPAVDARVLSDEGSGRRRFSHILFREALYRALGVQRRAALHAEAAKVARSDMERAHHLFLAAPVVPVTEAVEAARTAARRAHALLAFEDAALLYEEASAALGRTGLSLDQGELLLELAEAHFWAGSSRKGQEAAREAAGVARRLGEASLFARAALAFGNDFNPGVVNSELVALLQEARLLLPPALSAERARVEGRLAGALQPAPDPEGPMTMARHAIAMARELGAPNVLLGVLHTAGSALADFADPSERAALNREAAELAASLGEKSYALRARARLVFDETERGEFDAAASSLRTYDEMARELRRPHHQWPAPLCRAMRAVQEGRFDAGRAFAEEAQKLGLLAEDPRFPLCFLLHRFGVARARFDSRGLADVERELDSFFGQNENGLFSTYSTFVRAGIAGQLGNRERARACLDQCDDRGITIECVWLAEAALCTGDAGWAGRLFARMWPLRDRFVCWGMSAMICEGSYSSTLASLAVALGRPSEAWPLFEAAVTAERRAGARPALSRTLFEYGTALRKGGRASDVPRSRAALEEATALGRALGLTGLLARYAVGDEPASPNTLALSQEGEYWTLRAGSDTFRFRDTRGFSWLATLLSCPGEEIHVLDLAAREGAGSVDGGDAGELLDRTAVARYRRRLDELREAAEDAESLNDSSRSEAARAEMEAIASALSSGTGLGGRDRRSGSAVERARVNVQRRLRDAIRRIGEQCPSVGRTLDARIRTGVFCSYAPTGVPNRQKITPIKSES